MNRMWNTLIVGTRAMEKRGMINKSLQLHLSWKNFVTESNMSRSTGKVSKNPPKSIEYIVLPEERIDEALAVLEDSMRREPVAMAFGLYDKASSVAQMELFYRLIIKDGYSMIAVDKQTDRVVGVFLNKIQVPPKNGEVDPALEFIDNNLTDEACREMMKFYRYVESRVDIFRSYNVKCVMEIAYGGVKSQLGHLGVGQTLYGACVELARHRGKSKHANDVDGNGIIAPEAAFSVCTSNFAQRVATINNFEWLATFSYEEYSYRGVKLSEKIGDVHKTIKIGGLRLV